MTHKRYANKVDANQKKIVQELRKIPGVSVELDHNDILVGFRDKTYWFEIKNPNRYRKDGTPKKNAYQESQLKLQKEFNGHYSIVTTSKEIMQEIGVL